VPLSPSERVLRARIAAHDSWATTTDRTSRTAAGRAAMLDRFEREVDPDSVLTLQEREIRAEHARKAYFTRLAFKSARSRRRAAEARAAIPALEAEAEAEAAAADAEALAAGGAA